LSKEEKKKYGIFISPKSIISLLFSIVEPFLKNNSSPIKRILEPSCGTCEIINYCDKLVNNVEIDGVEINKKIFDSIKDLKFENNVKLYKEDFIQFKSNNPYDLIITNPPYFVCKKSDISQEYQGYIYGRPNIFGLFILHSLNLLKPGGILAFIVPKSFLNSLYYSKIRNHIKDTCTIIKIDDYSKQNNFMDTEQSTFGLVIQKNIISVKAIECKYSVLINNNFIFTNNSTLLNEIFAGATTLEKMGLKVRTGQVVWNENKECLTDDEDATLLIYNTNISKDNKLEIKKFANNEKKQYIKSDGRTDPVLVVNRGNGNTQYKLNYSIITERKFLTENHLNEIYSEKKMKESELIKTYEKIIESFKNPKTKKFIDIFLGNNSLSKTELETIFPIYLNP
jgi:SAM-dependent methyltransferase